MDKNIKQRFEAMPLVNVAEMRGRYDPDLPNASAVLAALGCVVTQYALKPSIDLAILASDLAHQLTAPQYAESVLITDVASRLAVQWDSVVDSLHDAAMIESAKCSARH